MKKIININLSGRVIPIEDSAYENLQNYIDSLRRYFAHEEGRDEIINDIESRIAELMSEKIRKGSAAITDADIAEIMASMGRPEDFEAEEAEFSSTQQTQSTGTQEQTFSARKKRTRLYRDADDKILGGVCAGIANYLNVDPAIVRILFAIITFGGVGMGFFIYILLWIVLPARELEHYGGRRLYRNPDDRILGGVASGLAAYFKKEAWVLRLIFLAPIILNIIFSIFSWPFFHEGVFFPNIVFGSLTGTFILAYIVLWIVLPEANTEYQQMEMRGEKVDLNRIRQNVRDKAKEFGQEVKSAAQNVSSKASEFANTRGREMASEMRSAGRRVGSGIGRVIAVLFKVFFLFIAGTIAFGLFVGLLALIFGGVGLWPFKNYVLDGFWQNTFAWGTLIFFLGVPLIAFITWLVRRMMRVRSQSNYLGWTFGGLWALGWISASLFAASMVSDFRMSNIRTAPTNLAVAQPLQGKMIVRVSEPVVEYSGSFPWFDAETDGFDLTRDYMKIANVRVVVQQSKDSSYHVEIKKYSRGRTVAEAEARARKMEFNVIYSDSILDVGSGITIDKDSKFRLQQAVVLISVPSGKKIRFDESINKLRPMNVRTRDKYGWSGWERDYQLDFDEHFDYEVNVDYVMGADGNLVNPLKPKGTPEERNNLDYRYNDKEQKKKELDERERKLKEEQQRLDEERRRLNDSTSVARVRTSKIVRQEQMDQGFPNVSFDLLN